MSPFDAVQYVGTPLALAAFVVAAGATVYRARLVERRKLIETAPESERAGLLDKTINDFAHVKPGELTKEQRYQLAVRLIEERAARFRTMALAGMGTAVLLAVVIVVGASPKPDPTSPLTVRVQAAGGADITVGVVTLDAGPVRDTQRVGANGQVHFPSVATDAFEGGVVLTARVPGYAPTVDTLRAVPANAAHTLVLDPEPTRVYGVVVDEAGRPVPEVTLLFDGGVVADTTDAQGRFRVELARPPGARVPVRLLRGDVVGFNDLVTLPVDEALTLQFAPRT